MNNQIFPFPDDHPRRCVYIRIMKNEVMLPAVILSLDEKGRQEWEKIRDKMDELMEGKQ
jgi:hypothetical protein